MKDDARASAAIGADLALLRRYEPIIRYTAGEEFFPLAVDRYLEACSLWLHHRDGRDEVLVEEGALTLDTLGLPRPTTFGSVLHLRFVDPLNLAELTAFFVREGLKRLRDHENRFRADLGRLARVGYGSRLLDAVFSLTLLLRGRVPGDAAAAAAITYRELLSEDPRFVYYGRVVRESDWVVLQYWFFYAFNNWRSGFYGGNDHEGDWETMCVYLYRDHAGALTPAWVAYATHDFQGDDIRRAWSDREQVELVGDHPVIYAGAGSHASYFQRGEYITEVGIPFLDRPLGVLGRFEAIVGRLLRRSVGRNGRAGGSVFKVPFIDYARGDGAAIGPGTDLQWSPAVLDPVPPWVSQYRGLWGLHARDPISNENAPAGPMYNRDGSVRQAWYDPLGWVGLDRVPNPNAETQVLDRRLEQLRERRDELRSEIGSRARELQELGVEQAALVGNPHLELRHRRLLEQIRGLRGDLAERRREDTQTVLLLEALEQRKQRLLRGERDDPRGHVARLARPSTDSDLRLNWWVELWAAASIGLLLIGFVVLLVYARQFLFVGLLGMIGSFVFVESVFRRQVDRLISSVTVALALISCLVLVYEFFWQLVIFSVLAAGLYIIWENLGELRG